jgi:creatinine amidohydrolase
MDSSILEISHWKNIKDAKFELAVMAWGATEAHNYHLPYGTDIFESEAFGSESVKLANSKGARAILLPVMPFGVNTGQSDIPLTINLNPSTQHLILEDVIESVYESGIKKFLIINSHGGNDFKQILREIGKSYEDMMLVTCNWFQSIDKTRFFENGGDHADEMETSLMLYLYPDLVLPMEDAGDGKHKTFSIPSLNEGWAWSERKWTSVTKDTGIGNPKLASAEKGEKYFKAVVEKLSQLILDISKTRTENLFK